MRRLRVLSEHPYLGRPGEIVRGFEGAQAYVDIGICEWVDEEPELAMVPAVIDRAQPPETTTAIVAGGEVEVTSPRPSGKPATRAGRTRRTAVDTSPDVTP
jgi:hypothetical protein